MRNLNIFLSNKTVFATIFKIALGVLVLFASAQISIPIKPVVITLQTLVVMIIGLTYSKKEALTTMITYLSCGALGIPMFTNMQGGFAKITGPTGGYLLGFLLAVYAMSYMKEKFNLTNFYNCLLGQVLIYIPGVLWLSSFIGMEAAIYKGFLIYIPSGPIKVAMLVSMLRFIKPKAKL